MSKQAFEPAGIEGLDIVVQKNQVFAACGGSAEVIHMREVEGFGVNHAAALKLIYEHFHRRIFGSLVLHYDDFVTRVASLTMNREQASAKYPRITRTNDNAD